MISSSSVILWFQSVEAVERIISPASRFSLLSVRRESVVVCILNSSRNFVLSWKLTISFLQIFFFFWFLFQSDLRFTSPLKYWRDTWIWALRDFNRKFYSSSHPGLNRTILKLHLKVNVNMEQRTKNYLLIVRKNLLTHMSDRCKRGSCDSYERSHWLQEISSSERISCLQTDFS